VSSFERTNGRKEGIHAKDNQQRCSSNSSVGRDLEIWERDAERSILSPSDKALTSVKVSQNLRSGGQNAAYGGRCGTRLTVNWPGSVKADHVRDHRRKGSHASKGVQLYKTNINLLRQWQNPEGVSFITDPYRPSVGAMPPDDTPLIIKVDDEFPAGNRRLSPEKGRDKVDAHVQTIHGVPELHDGHCRKTDQTVHWIPSS